MYIPDELDKASKVRGATDFVKPILAEAKFNYEQLLEATPERGSFPELLFIVVPWNS